MQLIVGLGNPGDRYQNNRHNIGFMAVDRIGDDYGFGPARTRFQGEVREGVIAGEKCLLLKPQTFMNKSGQSVGEAIRFYKLEPDQILVIYDELDLAPGKIRMKLGGGHGGHNGIRDIHAHIGPHYRRLRIGVGHPGSKEQVTGHVLSNFAKADQSWLDPLLDAISSEIPWVIKGDEARFSTAVALKLGKDKKDKEQD